MALDRMSLVLVLHAPTEGRPQFSDRTREPAAVAPRTRDGHPSFE